MTADQPSEADQFAVIESALHRIESALAVAGYGPENPVRKYDLEAIRTVIAAIEPTQQREDA